MSAPQFLVRIDGTAGAAWSEPLGLVDAQQLARLCTGRGSSAEVLVCTRARWRELLALVEQARPDQVTTIAWSSGECACGKCQKKHHAQPQSQAIVIRARPAGPLPAEPSPATVPAPPAKQPSAVESFWRKVARALGFSSLGFAARKSAARGGGHA